MIVGFWRVHLALPWKGQTHTLWPICFHIVARIALVHCFLRIIIIIIIVDKMGNSTNMFVRCIHFLRIISRVHFQVLTGKESERGWSDMYLWSAATWTAARAPGHRAPEKGRLGRGRTWQRLIGYMFAEAPRGKGLLVAVHGGDPRGGAGQRKGRSLIWHNYTWQSIKTKNWLITSLIN